MFHEAACNFYKGAKIPLSSDSEFRIFNVNRSLCIKIVEFEFLINSLSNNLTSNSPPAENVKGSRKDLPRIRPFITDIFGFADPSMGAA